MKKSIPNRIDFIPKDPTKYSRMCIVFLHQTRKSSFGPIDSDHISSHVLTRVNHVSGS